jgi:hypothetical protein
MDLQEMYADFERWMPGVFSGRDIVPTPGIMPACMSAMDRWERNTAALIESAVLDELERRGTWGINIEPNQINLFSRHVAGHFTTFQMHKGHGPTRLARLHAACKQAFGGG